MLVLLMEIFRVKFKYQKTFNGRQGIQQMTETVFSLHVIPLFAGSYISCPSSTLSLMKIRAKNKIFFFFKRKPNCVLTWLQRCSFCPRSPTAFMSVITFESFYLLSFSCSFCCVCLFICGQCHSNCHYFFFSFLESGKESCTGQRKGDQNPRTL